MLPWVALACSVAGVLLCPLMLLGFALGATALAKKRGPRGPAIAAMAFPLVAGPAVLAVAIPNFFTFKSRSRQTECRTYLQAAYHDERAYFGEHQRYSVHPTEVDFRPERGNRYLYLFTAEGPLAPNIAAPKTEAVGVGADSTQWPDPSNDQLIAGIPAEVKEQLGIKGECPKCEVTIACAGNLDSDPAIDVWTISTAARGEIPAGVARREVDDSTTP